LKTVRFAIHAVVCGLGFAAAQPALSAEVQPGFYLGVSGGESSFDIEKSELDGVFLDVMRSQGLLVTSNRSTFEDSDTSLALFAGYHFNQYIAVEAGYLDLGAAEYRSTGTINPPGPVVSAPTAMNVEFESTGFTLAGLGSLPLGDFVELHGRLGLFFAQTDLSVTASIATATATDTDSLDSIGGFFGLGAGFNLGEHWSLSLDWTRYDNVGDEDEDDDASTEAGFDIDTLSFSAMFRF
jgi:opacity protein-like surface antigen